MEQTFKAVNYDFYVYLIHRYRDNPQRYVSVHLVSAPGHTIAQSMARNADADFSKGITTNSFDLFFGATKRAGAMSTDRERGSVEFKGRSPITAQQSEYFASHPQMNP